MTIREIAVDGVRWTVWVAERYSPLYGGDEVPIVFESRDREGRRLRRVARYSPAGGRRSPEPHSPPGPLGPLGPVGPLGPPDPLPTRAEPSGSAGVTLADTLLKRNLAAGGSDRGLPALTALADLSEAELAALLGRSQPAWTSPELGHEEG